jgi:hypothetical protein
MLKLFKVLGNRELAEMSPAELTKILQEPGGLDAISVGLFHDPYEDASVSIRPLPEQPRWADERHDPRAA